MTTAGTQDCIPRQGDALLIVDVQNDFLPGGSLAVPQGDDVVPVLNRYCAAFRTRHLPIFASRDWHPSNHCSFTKQGGPWPPHCVAETEGAQFASGLDLSEAVIISKATEPGSDAYSAFENTDLDARLKQAQYQTPVRGWIGDRLLCAQLGARCDPPQLFGNPVGRRHPCGQPKGRGRSHSNQRNAGTWLPASFHSVRKPHSTGSSHCPDRLVSTGHAQGVSRPGHEPNRCLRVLYPQPPRPTQLPDGRRVGTGSGIFGNPSVHSTGKRLAKKPPADSLQSLWMLLRISGSPGMSTRYRKARFFSPTSR